MIAWRPFIEDNKYYREWINEQIINTIEGIDNIDELQYISTSNLIGWIEEYEDFQFYMCEVLNKKHIINLTFNNFEYFLKNILSRFDTIVTSHHNYPFMMLINKYAKIYNVEVVFIQHGMQNNISKGVGKTRIKGLFNASTFMSYVGLFRQLIFALKLDFKVTYLTIKNIFSKGSALIYPKYVSDEYMYSSLNVYSEKEKKIYESIYSKEKINIILDTDIKLYLKYKDIKYTSNKKYILYIDDMVIKDYNLYIKFNKVVENYCSQGFDFFYLPRGRNDQQDNFQKLSNKIIYLETRSINKYIDNAEYVISTWSTLLNLPIYLEKNIILLVNNEILTEMNRIDVYEKFNLNCNINFYFLKK